jgi:acetyltransferase-like isoleucine patch superfamily enzyme
MFGWFYKLLGKPVPYYAKYPLWLILWKPLRKFLNVVIIPNIPFTKLRVSLYRVIGYRIGKNVFIGMKCYLDDVDPKFITIGDNVVISYEVKFAVHGLNQSHTPIHLEKGAYIGMGAILVAGKNGITIGEKAVIGAGSVVTSSIPAGGIAVGVPARVIRIEDK